MSHKYDSIVNWNFVYYKKIEWKKYFCWGLFQSPSAYSCKTMLRTMFPGAEASCLEINEN